LDFIKSIYFKFNLQASCWLLFLYICIYKNLIYQHSNHWMWWYFRWQCDDKIAIILPFPILKSNIKISFKTVNQILVLELCSFFLFSWLKTSFLKTIQIQISVLKMIIKHFWNVGHGKVRTICRIYKMIIQTIGLNVIHLQYKTCEHMRVYSQQWEGRTLVQVKGSRVSLLCNVHACKLCIQYLKHKCEYKCVCL